MPFAAAAVGRVQRPWPRRLRRHRPDDNGAMDTLALNSFPLLMLAVTLLIIGSTMVIVEALGRRRRDDGS